MTITRRTFASVISACAATVFGLFLAGAAPSSPPAGATPAAAIPTPDPNHKPVIYLIGDSTVRNGSYDNGATAGQFGWGHILHYYFDPAKISVINDAMGGTSSRNYQTNNNLWGLVIPKVQAGDYVLMQFGHNDGGQPSGGKASLKGNGDDTQVVGAETVHSFGWYMRQYIILIKAKGATPIVCSLIPRNRWGGPNQVNRNTNDYALWAKQAAEQEHIGFIALNDLVADKYDKLGQTKVQAELFPPGEALHTNWAGAVVNAQTVVEGIKALKDCPLKDYLIAEPKVPEKPDITPQGRGELGPAGARGAGGRGRGAATVPASITATAPAP